jgi:transcriptional regulator GlxA family with amidase domain
MAPPKRIGFLGFPQLTALDLVGPMESFATVLVGDGIPRSGYEVLIIGVQGQTFESESGITIKAHRTLETAPPLDTVMIPGGAGLRERKINAKVCKWICDRADQIRRIASVCTGIYGLAPTGLLDGRKVTTHWRFAEDVARRFPKLQVVPNALFLKDGRFYTSAGITAGIDLALAMIEEDYGSTIALKVARDLVMYLKRPGGQEQYSAPLQFQTLSIGPFERLVPWMLEHLNDDLSVDALAQHASLSPRQFTRRFKQVFGRTPASFVGTLRLDEARSRLGTPEHSIETVANSVGFKSADVFRRAFERRFLITPRAYRGRFENESGSLLKESSRSG